jgi:hypothetical protein
MYAYMKKVFLENWRGSTTYGLENQWAKAQGSSLTEGEVKILNEGGIVKHAKGKSLTKIFVRDEEGSLWSVIVHNLHLASLEDDLKKIGYQLAVA